VAVRRVEKAGRKCRTERFRGVPTAANLRIVKKGSQWWGGKTAQPASKKKSISEKYWNFPDETLCDGKLAWRKAKGEKRV